MGLFIHLFVFHFKGIIHTIKLCTARTGSHFFLFGWWLVYVCFCLCLYLLLYLYLYLPIKRSYTEVQLGLGILSFYVVAGTQAGHWPAPPAPSWTPQQQSGDDTRAIRSWAKGVFRPQSAAGKAGSDWKLGVCWQPGQSERFGCFLWDWGEGGRLGWGGEGGEGGEHAPGDNLGTHW